MGDPDKVWEDRKLHKNGSGGYDVNIPKSWLKAMKLPASDVLNLPFLIFEYKNGKGEVRLADWMKASD